jgi:hypothetical protein
MCAVKRNSLNNASDGRADLVAGELIVELKSVELPRNGVRRIVLSRR